MAKDVNFIFGMHAPGESHDMIPENVYENGAWPWVT